MKWDKKLLSKANQESDAGKEEKVKAIWDIKKAKRHNQCCSNCRFYQGTGVSAQESNQIQIPKVWKTMEEYVEEIEFKWEDIKRVNKVMTLCGEWLKYQKNRILSFETESTSFLSIWAWIYTIYNRDNATEIWLECIYWKSRRSPKIHVQ